MWVCPKCKAENNDSLIICRLCHTEPDGTEHPRPKPAGMPRRFSIGTLMILIALFGILFAILKICNSPPFLFAIIGIYFVVIGASQAVLFKGKKPRTASIIVGGTFAFVIYIIMSIWITHVPVAQLKTLKDVIIVIFLGCFFGYISGCLFASIFLVREREKESAENDDLQSTFDADDKEEDG
jgi:hypothetical protein